MTSVETSLATFTWQLYQKLLNKDSKQNLVFSPISIQMALNMVLVGARKKTAEEMRATMHLSSFDQNLIDEKLNSAQKQLLSGGKEGALFLMANKLCVEKSFQILPVYAEILQKQYRSEAESLDFKTGSKQSTVHINNWVAEQTKGKIQNLLSDDSLDADTKLVILNAVYFKGQWMTVFFEAFTTTAKFHVDANTVKDVKMMYKTDYLRFARDKTLGCLYLEMPFLDDNVVMWVMLPEKRGDLARVEREMTADKLLDTIKNAKETQVDVRLPRFSVDETIGGLKETLHALGIVDLFTRGQSDLSGITGSTDLFVTKVIHKACLEVNEMGAEASASTAMIAMPMCMPPEPEETFTADHPFMVALYDKSCGIFTFLGRVANPSF